MLRPPRQLMSQPCIGCPCSRRAVLVGDAAHSVYPALGQGANAALEGAVVLAATLKGGSRRARRPCPRAFELG